MRPNWHEQLAYEIDPPLTAMTKLLDQYVASMVTNIASGIVDVFRRFLTFILFSAVLIGHTQPTQPQRS